MGLTLYNKKRNFKATDEPEGKKEVSGKFRFVVQRHEATRLHYDFRLELDGVLKSWAVPRGPSMNTTDKRLAVMVEDHPVSYLGFQGRIPEGNYGAGRMRIWDKGLYFPVNEQNEKISERQALQSIKKGELKLVLKGKKIQGGFVLVRLRKDEKNWLLIKHKDEYASSKPYDSEQFADKVEKSAPAKKKRAVASRNVAKKSPPKKRSAAKKKSPAKTSKKSAKNAGS